MTGAGCAAPGGSPVVALLTDFGASAYPGILKGVIQAISPGVTVIDLSHHVRPQAVREGAWVLLTAYPYFPPGTVFCCVVDPGVGSDRQALAVQAGPFFFVGPDNGLLAPALAASAAVATVVRLPVPATASHTFHGRDVFAPAAARLAAGVPLLELGPLADPPVPLTFHRRGWEGEVVTIDPFGNIITNLPPAGVCTQYRVELRPGPDGTETTGWQQTLALHPTYTAAPPERPFLIIGSAHTLEIAVASGNAARVLAARPGQRIRIEPR